VIVSYEAIRKWCRKFSQQYAINSGVGGPGRATSDTWTRCFSGSTRNVTISRSRLIKDGNVLNILVYRQRDKQAAKQFFHKLLKGLTYELRVIITDKLKNSGPKDGCAIEACLTRTARLMFTNWAPASAALSSSLSMNTEHPASVTALARMPLARPVIFKDMVYFVAMAHRPRPEYRLRWRSALAGQATDGSHRRWDRRTGDHR
jgi:hypothetical protein